MSSDVYARLACGHQWFIFASEDAVGDVLIQEDVMPRRADGWFAALTCRICRRRRAVTSALIQDSNHRRRLSPLHTEATQQESGPQ